MPTRSSFQICTSRFGEGNRNDPLLEIAQSPSGKGGRLLYGWWVVMTAGLGLGLGYAPIIVYSFGIFLKPLLQEFHSSRGNISLAFTLASLAHAITSPLVGRWADRFGARKVILLGSAVFASILVFSLTLPTSLWKLYLFFILLGIAGSGAAPVPYSKIISNWFDKRRGLALGLTMFGLGSGAIIMPSLAQRLIAIFGWRGAYAAIGLLVLVICLPAVGLFLKETPEEIGYLSDGVIAAQPTITKHLSVNGVAWRDARYDYTFWIMVSAFFLMGTSVQGCIVHLVPMLTDRGITPDRAALGSSLLGGAILIGRVVTGYLLDRFFAPRVAMFFFSAPALGIALLWSGAENDAPFLAALLIGLGVGAEVDIIAYLTSRYFGLRAFGEIYGYAFATFVLGSALGPWLMGLGFDHTGSYSPVLVGFLVATLGATLVTLRLGPYRYRAQSAS
jgi:MFS family permease